MLLERPRVDGRLAQAGVAGVDQDELEVLGVLRVGGDGRRLEVVRRESSAVLQNAARKRVDESFVR